MQNTKVLFSRITIILYWSERSLIAMLYLHREIKYLEISGKSIIILKKISKYNRNS